LKLGHTDSAQTRYEAAYALSEKFGSPSGSARSLAQLADIQSTKQNLDSASSLLLRADSIAARNSLAGTLADIAISMARVNWLRGRPDSSLSYKKRAATEYTDAGMFKRAIETLNSIGLEFDRSRRPDSAIAYFVRAERLLPSVKLSDIDRGLLSSVGDIYARLNMSDSALAFGERALIAFRSQGNLRRQVDILLFLGFRYSILSRYDRAFALEDSALTIARSLNDRSLEAPILNNSGWQLAHLGRESEALERIRRALAYARQSEDTFSQIFALHSLGYTFGKLGYPDSLAYYYQQSLELRRIRAANGSTSSRLNLAIGLSWVGQLVTASFPDSALKLQREALAIARDVRDESAEAEALRGIGSALLRRRLPGDIRNATAFFDTAASLISFIRGRAGEELNRVTFAEQSLALFEEWTLSWLAREKEIGAEAAALGALAASERGRAQALLDLTRGQTSVPSPGQDMVAEGRALLRRAIGGTSSALVYFAARDSLVIWTIDRALHIQARIVPVTRESLANWVTDYRSALGVDEASIGPRLVTRGGFKLEQMQPRKRGRLESAESPGPHSIMGDSLQRAILPAEVSSVLEGTALLTVVPEGPLGMLPFAALTFPGEKGKLGDHLAIRYLPSLSLATTTANSAPIQFRQARVSSSALVVGNPRMPTVRGVDGTRVFFTPIAASASEARKVSSLLQTQPLLGERATEHEVKARLATASVVHLATHGYAYAAEQRSRDSFVALTPGSGDDGLLTVGEIMDGPRLRSSLIVLSACQTGLGNLKFAEGTVGLQRALLAKGAETVLVSLWSVSDCATFKLMSQFYYHLLRERGNSKAVALRLAQNDLRATGPYRDPRYWAAFQLVGAP
jgi:tetratricopeptide (TPR) repeat protein